MSLQEPSYDHFSCKESLTMLRMNKKLWENIEWIKFFIFYIFIHATIWIQHFV